MSDSPEQKKANYKQAYETGLLDEADYRDLLAKLGLPAAEIETLLSGSGVITQESELEGGDQSVVGSSAGGDINTGDTTIVYAEQGATVVIGEAPVEMDAVDADSQLGLYLQNVISRNRYLQLQGIRSGGRLVHIELDHIYITLRATRQRLVEPETHWLTAEAVLAPGERRRGKGQFGQFGGEGQPTMETVTVSVNEALADTKRLVVLGDPGSGKTTLMRYLALLYAQDVANKGERVQNNLGLSESGYLPILLYLRQIGAFLKARRPNDDGTEGHALLLDFLYQSLEGERINLPPDFFDAWLHEGRAVILLDGLDEVADPELRRRVARLVEAFCRAYPTCRFVITSRVVGYEGAVRLSEDFSPTTVRDFTLAEVTRFLTGWHHLIAVGQMGPGPAAEAHAQEQTRQLVEAIEENERVRELAINPLMLTVIAMVHRDRVKLPDRRAELYAEAIEVLLGKWDEARGVAEVEILEDQPFDTGDRRLMLQNLALYMHEHELKEIAVADLEAWLVEAFLAILNDERKSKAAVKRFLKVIAERTGLLVARGEGVYAFSHLTFQEYLAALAIESKDNYIRYTLSRSDRPWWREVILLEAGYLSSKSVEKTTRLIKQIADKVQEPEPYHNLVLAAECLRDVGRNRVLGNLEQEIQQRLRADLELDLQAEIERRRPEPLSGWESFWSKVRGEQAADFNEEQIGKEIASRKVAAAQALAQIGGETYWTTPYGEPEWVEIPGGKFWLGEDEEYDKEKPQHQHHLDTFLIARTPITNAQYHLFVADTEQPAPRLWEDNRPAKEIESHPVVVITWHQAMAYCRWLSEKIGQPITLPSEAEWEKAARGHSDKRKYPWGDTFEATRCNSRDLGLNQTTPVGIFPNGASPYDCLDMAGNVWEWTRSLWGNNIEKPEFKYPYDPTDGRENLDIGDDILRVLRGGAYFGDPDLVRCAIRSRYSPDLGNNGLGFRVVVSPLFTSET